MAGAARKRRPRNGSSRTAHQASVGPWSTVPPPPEASPARSRMTHPGAAGGLVPQPAVERLSPRCLMIDGAPGAYRTPARLRGVGGLGCHALDLAFGSRLQEPG